MVEIVTRLAQHRETQHAEV